jgi:hypothetical protein
MTSPGPRCPATTCCFRTDPTAPVRGGNWTNDAMNESPTVSLRKRDGQRVLQIAFDHLRESRDGRGPRRQIGSAAFPRYHPGRTLRTGRRRRGRDTFRQPPLPAAIAAHSPHWARSGIGSGLRSAAS